MSSFRSGSRSTARPFGFSISRWRSRAKAEAKPMEPHKGAVRYTAYSLVRGYARQSLGGLPDAAAEPRRLHENDLTAQEVLVPAIEFARRVGIPKLEADAYSVQAHLALAHGETELAWRLALACLGLASSMGMVLRLTASLVMMGRVAHHRGEAKAARDLLRSAVELGRGQGYHLQVEQAERELMHMGAWSDETVRQLGFARLPSRGRAPSRRKTHECDSKGVAEVLFEKLKALPPQRLEEVEDFVDFLKIRDEKARSAAGRPAARRGHGPVGCVEAAADDGGRRASGDQGGALRTARVRCGSSLTPIRWCRACSGRALRLRRSEASGRRNIELPADGADRSLFDLPVARDARDLTIGRVEPDRVASALAEQRAAVPAQVALQLGELHASARSRISRNASGDRFFSASSRWHSTASLSASRRFALASSSVSP